jgi:iron complex outermembrane recepter protein
MKVSPKRGISSAVRASLAAAGASTWVAMAAQAQAPSTAQPAAAEDQLEEVFVTGSRVITNGNDAPTPVTVVTPEQVLATKPTNLYENLVDMPVFSGSRGASNGPVTTSPNAGSGTQPNGAISSLNLRNMGPLRTLVLFDGKRLPPVSPDGMVDPTSLPQMLIQRVDVVTGGVSAVYGSDAITGVVNFVTDSNFTGVKSLFQYGISQEGDADSWQAGIAGGTDLFGGRGHVIGSFQHSDSDPLYDTDRDWAAHRWGVYGNGTTVPYRLLAGQTTANASFGGSIACYAGANNGSVNPANCPTLAPSPGTALYPYAPQSVVGLTFKQNGVLSPFNAGGPRDGLTLATVQNGGDGAYFVNVAMNSAQVTDQFFGRFDFDFTENVRGYISGAYNSNEVEGNIGTQRTFPPGVDVSSCNAFLTAAVQTQLGCVRDGAGNITREPVFRFEKQIDPRDNFGIGQNNKLKSDTYFVMAALEGQFGDGYRWDAAYTRSETDLEVSGLNQNREHIYASMDAVRNAAGQIVCRITITNPTAQPGCIPTNAFGPTAASEAAISYWFDTITQTTENTLDGLAASLTGSPFNSWAGPIDMALSAEYRKLKMSLDSDSSPTDLVDCTGIRFGPTTTNGQAGCNATVPVHPNTFAPIYGANQTVAEAAFELNLPLIKDRSIFQEVDFNGAVRYAEYDNDPNNSAVISRKFDATTWKAGLTWDLNDELTLRWTRSKDFRAPSLYDLYLPVALGATTNITDYLVGGTPPARQGTGGNPSLDPETAHTTTLGVVWRPTENFSLSLDGYKIIVKDVLFQLNGSNEFVQKTCYASGGVSPTCQLHDRPLGYTNTTPANAMTAFYIRSVNIASQETSGIDLESSWGTHLFDQPLVVRALVTYQPHILYNIPFAARQDVAGVAYPQVGGLPAPVWKALLFLHYNVSERWTIDLSERYRSSLGFSSAPNLPNTIGKTSSVAYTNMSVSYDVPTRLEQVNVFLNVQNLFDKDPPAAGGINNNFPGAYPSNYAVGDDTLGRYFTLGVRIRL